MIFLRYSTASQEIPLGMFVDSTDGNSEETGLTIANTDIKLWKAGATTLANKNSGGATHISNGVYYAVLDATDTDTLGSLVIFVHVSGALYVRLECVVLPQKVYDSLIAGSDTLEVDAIQWLGTAILTPGTAGTPDVNAIGPTASGIADAVLDELMSGHTTTGSLAKLISDMNTLITAIKSKSDALPAICYPA